MSTIARWGSQIEVGSGRALIRDRSGSVVARLDSDRAWLQGAPGREIEIAPDRDGHIIFGPCARITQHGELCSLMGAVDWRAPATIPPVASPAQLPRLTGTMVLNLLAHCAAAAGIASLRYVGPYPSSALYASLTQSFVALDSETVFTAAGPALLVAPQMLEAPVDFRPAPFERWWPGHEVAVQARATIERVYVHGASFERSPTALRRLVERGDTLAAELWFGDALWATVVELDREGALRRGPLSLPLIEDPIVGAEIPLGLRGALASLIIDTVPDVLAAMVAPILATSTLRWGDAGMDAVQVSDGVVMLHAGLWMSLRSHGAARVALAMAEALTPWVVAEAVRRSLR